jgi:streptogramin lyase
MKSSSVPEPANYCFDPRQAMSQNRGSRLTLFAASIRRFTACFVLCLCALGSAGHAQTAHFFGAQIPVPVGTLTSPYGIAVDVNGNIYVADNATNSLVKVTPSGTILAGHSFLTGDGNPYGIAVDASGNLFVTDKVSNEVAKQTLQPGGYYKKTVLPFKGLNQPLGVAVDAQGNVYVADSQNNRVLKATPFESTYTQSLVPTSSLSRPEGVAVDAQGDVYVADTLHLRVLKETPSGSNWSESVVADLNSSAAPPIGVAADAAGDVFILTYLSDVNFAVLKATLANGSYSLSDLPPGQNPFGIAADAGGDTFVVSPGTNELAKIFAGAGNFGAVQVTGVSPAITFNFMFDKQSTLGAPAVMTKGITGNGIVTPLGPNYDYANAGTGSCGNQSSTFVYNPGDTCTVDVIFEPQLPGSREGAVVLADASGNTIATGYDYGAGVSPLAAYPPGYLVSVATNLVDPTSLAADAAGDVFVAETSTGNVWKETESYSIGYTYTQSAVASGLSNPTGVALDGAGNVYVVTLGSIYKEAPVNGSYVQSQVFTNLTGLVAIAADASGNLYFTSSSGAVHEDILQANGTFQEGAIGTGIASPAGIAVDGSGNVFIVDTKSNNLYIETLSSNGSYMQTTFALGLAAPQGLAVDGNGYLYVVDSTHGEIDKLTPQRNGSYVETVARSGLPQVAGVAVNGNGNFYYSQTSGSATMVDFVDAQSLVFPPAKLRSTTDGSQTLSNIGNAGLVFIVPSYGVNPLTGPPFALNPDTTCPIIEISGVEGTLDPGDSCVYNISFTPAYNDNSGGFLEISFNTLNEPDEQDGNLIFLDGAVTSWDSTRTTMRISPNPVQVDLGVTITVTVVNTTNASIVPQGVVTVTDTVGSQVTTLNGGAAVTLSNGKATLTMVPSVAGTHTITAYFGGGNGFLATTGQASLPVQQ